MTTHILKYPKDTKITGRSSTIRGSFIKAIIPTIQATEKQKAECLKRLGQNKKELFCCYCGDRATEWDHFRAIVTKKGPSGYVTDIFNLVPSCGKCNQSKSGKDWDKWIVSRAKFSPKTRNVKNLAARIKILNSFHRWSDKYVTKMPQEFIDGDIFKTYMRSCETLIKSLKKYQIKAEAIKVELQAFKSI